MPKSKIELADVRRLKLRCKMKEWTFIAAKKRPHDDFLYDCLVKNEEGKFVCYFYNANDNEFYKGKYFKYKDEAHEYFTNEME